VNTSDFAMSSSASLLLNLDFVDTSDVVSLGSCLLTSSVETGGAGALRFLRPDLVSSALGET